jgi:hypothetical protein
MTAPYWIVLKKDGTPRLRFLRGRLIVGPTKAKIFWHRINDRWRDQ